MRFVLTCLAIFALLRLASPAEAQSCSDDYISVETIIATIVEIKPAPEPFSSADIFLKGPERCPLLWMQVLKKDAAQCRVGDHVEAKGIVTSDSYEGSWQINPERNDYMLLNADFTCTR